MKKTKRDLLIAAGIIAPAAWSKPIVEILVLPAHGRMSYDEPPPDDNGSDDPPPDDDTSEDPDGACRDGKIEICHHPAQQGTEPFELCVAEPAVPAHVRNHGDTIGKCE